MDFSKLKPGDTVVVNQFPGAFHPFPYLFETVVSVGAKKIKTDAREYSASHGGEWGSNRYTAIYCIVLDMSIEEARKLNVEIENGQERRELAAKMSIVYWRDLPLDVLQTVNSIIEKAKKG